MAKRLHKGIDPQTGQMVSEKALETSESNFRRTNPYDNDPAAVRMHAEYIAGQTGADADAVEKSLLALWPVDESDADVRYFEDDID